MPFVKLLVGRRLYATGGKSSGTRRIPSDRTAASTHLKTPKTDIHNVQQSHRKTPGLAVLRGTYFRGLAGVAPKPTLDPNTPDGLNGGGKMPRS